MLLVDVEVALPLAGRQRWRTFGKGPHHAAAVDVEVAILVDAFLGSLKVGGQLGGCEGEVVEGIIRVEIFIGHESCQTGRLHGVLFERLVADPYPVVLDAASALTAVLHLERSPLAGSAYHPVYQKDRHDDAKHHYRHQHHHLQGRHVVHLLVMVRMGWTVARPMAVAPVVAWVVGVKLGVVVTLVSPLQPPVVVVSPFDC